MKGKFDIPGRTPGHPSPAPIDDVMHRFIDGAEPMTTMTVQIPERLKRVLKQTALDRQMTVKALLIELIERDLVHTNK
jgi:hypothetical protein